MVQRWNDYAAIPLRTSFGIIFVAHGAQKLFGWFGGAGLESTASFLASLGLTPGPFWAVVAGVVELVGGIALLVGFATPWTAIALAARTLAALILVNAPAGFSAMQGGVEFPLALLGGLLALVCTGAQAYSLDARLPVLRGVKPTIEAPQKKAA